MQKTKNQELFIFLVIVGIASFFRLYKLDISSGIFQAVIGILTVVGIYLLAKEMFEWRLAAIASYLTAISFWHVNFSRTESAAIIIPFMLVYGFYFLWKGIKMSRLPYFFIAGIFTGLGFYTPAFYIAPLITLILFINYWWYLKKDFGHEKYEHSKNKLLQGFVFFAFTAFLVASPISMSFWQHQSFFSPITISGESIIKTLAMFNFTDYPVLPWPIGVFFVVGLINELIHWFKKKHGHYSTVHTLMFAWFVIALVPGFLSDTAPNLWLTIGVLPAVMIITARGIWWLFDKLRSWYSLRDPHSIHEAHAVTALVMIIFLFSIGFMEYWRYFIK